MGESAYPDLEAHRADHERLLDEMRDLVAGVRQGRGGRQRRSRHAPGAVVLAALRDTRSAAAHDVESSLAHIPAKWSPVRRQGYAPKNKPTRSIGEGAAMAHAFDRDTARPAAPASDAFDWQDPLRIDDELTEEERLVRETAQRYAQEQLFPRVLTAYREERFDRAILDEMGELGLLGTMIPEQYGGAGLGAVCLRPDRARDRAGRFRLSLGHVGAGLAGHVSDPRLRHRGAAAQVSAEAGARRAGRLLRPHRARPRLRPGLDAHARREGRGRLPARRRKDVDHQLADRRPRDRLGEARRRDPRLHRRARHQRLFHAEDRGQAVAARLGHRRDRARRRRRAGSRTCCPAQKVSPARSAASTRRGSASPGAPWGRPSSAGTAPANTCSTASSSGGRSPPTS